MAVAGGYLIYLAYELIRDLVNHVPTSMAPALTVIIGVLFAGIGLGLIVFAWKLWKKGREGNEADRVEITEEDERTKEEQSGPGK